MPAGNVLFFYFGRQGITVITSLENLVDGKLLSIKELLIQDVKQLGVAEALIKHTENLPEKAEVQKQLEYMHQRAVEEQREKEKKQACAIAIQ
jgi:lipid A disaccharide synthetase